MVVRQGTGCGDLCLAPPTPPHLAFPQLPWMPKGFLSPTTHTLSPHPVTTPCGLLPGFWGVVGESWNPKE